ncbi:MAG: twin-arginine translocation signal domain-containing protein [Bacteroidales bacterium]|nr:twin-arginine translocation signal domain-containing protein [Bacteroidales bacterium]
MVKKNFTRRDFIGKTSAGVAAAVVSSGISPLGLNSDKRASPGADNGKYSAGTFALEVEKLPAEEPYEYHRRLSASPVHIYRRDKGAQQAKDEMAIHGKGWKLIYNREGSVIIRNAIIDFQDYLDKSHDIKVEVEENDSLINWNELNQSIVVGTPAQLPGCGLTLRGKKDYEISVTPEQIVVCGYDESGAMYGLHNLEARMNLREAPFLPDNLKSVRHSLYDTRMVLSWMGWMEFPDQLLSHLAHDGYDGIFASVYANPNGDRTTAESSTEFYARLMYRVRQQDPEKIHDLIARAERFGIKVYTPIIYQYLGTPESEAGLRKLVRDIVTEFPGISGYVLLTEGFWYKEWTAGHIDDDELMKDWARNWCKAVSMVKEECHRIDPSIEILPWEYNIDFRSQKAELKRYFIKQLPDRTIPMLTWENGKSFELDGMKGYLRDYSLSQIGPAEVTEAQIGEAGKRGMRVFSKVDTFASWQFGTIPYLPCPQQWFKRYAALEKYAVKGTLESWSSGYKPNFISELRAWTCWSDAPSTEKLFDKMAARLFGEKGKAKAVKAWEYFSQAIQLVPDTGPNMGTNNAVGNPLFFRVPPLRTNTYNYSWTDFDKWMGYFGSELNPYWPFTVSRMVFFPDFTGKINRAEEYARNATGIEAGNETKLLPVFLRYMNEAADKMEAGLSLYREAALSSPESKRQSAVKEVIVAEQLHRMMKSDCAILEFEDLRLKHSGEKDAGRRSEILDQMEVIVREEIVRTELSLLAATRDSRLGFQFEQDYVYSPYSLKEKLGVLIKTLDYQLPNARKNS